MSWIVIDENIKKKIIDLINKKKSVKEISLELKLNIGTLYKFLKRISVTPEKTIIKRKKVKHIDISDSKMIVIKMDTNSIKKITKLKKELKFHTYNDLLKSLYMKYFNITDIQGKKSRIPLEIKAKTKVKLNDKTKNIILESDFKKVLKSTAVNEKLTLGELISIVINQ